MTSRTAGRRGEEHRRQVLAAARKQQAMRTRRRRVLLTGSLLVVLVGVVAAMMLSSRPTSSAATRTAPDFTLTDTSGNQVHLADYRGKSAVVLYFSEGAGCGSCLQQMGEIEKDRAAFSRAGLTVLPIVMNTRAQISHDMQLYGVRTPFLLDNGGAVSTAYGTIGRGMHAGLPGHSFVLVDKNGVQRWHGEYPSMWLAPADLLAQASKHLPS